MKHIMGKSSRSTLTMVQEGDVQPNACDLRLDKIYKIKEDQLPDEITGEQIQRLLEIIE